MARTAWLLNLDAEDELRRGDGHVTARATRERIGKLSTRLRALTGDDAELVDPWDPTPSQASGLIGRAWCPTPRARLALTIAGATVPAAPTMEVLRRVNHRAFAASLPRDFPGARFATSLDEVSEAVAHPTESGSWLLKPALGFAGRGHLRVAAGALDAATRAAVTALVEEDGGVQVEPWVTRLADFALHGDLAPDGTLTLGRPTIVHVDDRGVWRATEPATSDDYAVKESNQLHDSAQVVARALFEQRYWGPFNIDAFRWAHGTNSPQFDACCEINARFSMGYAVGMRMVKV